MRSFLLVLLIQAIVSAVSLEQEQPIAIVRVEDRLASNEYTPQNEPVERQHRVLKSSKARVSKIKSTKAPTVKSTKAPTIKSTKAPSIKSTKAPSIKSAKRQLQYVEEREKEDKILLLQDDSSEE